MPEYWVIDAKNLDLHVHRGPEGEGWTEVVKHPSSSAISPMLPALSIQLNEIVDLPD